MYCFSCSSKADSGIADDEIWHSPLRKNMTFDEWVKGIEQIKVSVSVLKNNRKMNWKQANAWNTILNLFSNERAFRANTESVRGFLYSYIPMVLDYDYDLNSKIFDWFGSAKADSWEGSDAWQCPYNLYLRNAVERLLSSRTFLI